MDHRVARKAKCPWRRAAELFARPMTGFFRDGAAIPAHMIRACMADHDRRVSRIQQERRQRPVDTDAAVRFPGLKDGDLVPVRRSLGTGPRGRPCAEGRFQSTNSVTLAVCKLEDLKAHAIDLHGLYRLIHQKEAV